MEKQTGTPVFRRLKLNGKTKDILLVALLALVVVLSAWTVFSDTDNGAATAAFASETEKKVGRILSSIEGVGEAEVVVCETENGVQSVVVVCEGANDLQVVMNVREAVAAALGTEQKSVKIYLKKV